MRARSLFATWSLASALCVGPAASAAPGDAPDPDDAPRAAQIERGRYLVVIGHCNNCHTAGYGAKSGAVPEQQWLMGNPVGWRGKAGTVYAPNLRLYVQSMSAEAWLIAARNARPRPPMPWWSLRETSDEDLTAMYWFMQSLKPAGSPAPAFLPPDQTPAPPYNQLPDLSPAR